MKKAVLTIVTVLVVFCAAFFLIRNCFGNTVFAQQQIGESDHFSREEIQDAMELVERVFAREFAGCTLLQLTYDEEFSQRRAQDWAENYGAEEGIVLLSSFTTGPSSVSGGFNPNDLYTRWQWILTRNEGDAWELRTWGYG